ncbi:MAG: CPBP family intramembrane metalloprotease [Alphaproteobacteria bacterium]|nr:CPBP family intramembrane metalloprotease [Alphaproteobacteria bacterium]
MSNILKRPGVAVGLALAVAAIVFLESTRAPWAPFFYGGALVTLLIPLAARTALRDDKRVKGTPWLAMAAALVGLLIVDALAMGPVLDAAGKNLGILPLSAALSALLAKAAASQHLSLDGASSIYAAFYVVWAPIAEELFYRGYLRQSLSPRLGEPMTAVISSALFALRHVPHLMYLAVVPWATIAVWTASVFAGGLILYWLVRRTGLLWPAIVVHLIDNVAGLMM